jgi:hypothetical protein
VRRDRYEVELVLFDSISEDDASNVISHLDRIGVRFDALRAAA